MGYAPIITMQPMYVRLPFTVHLKENGEIVLRGVVWSGGWEGEEGRGGGVDLYSLEFHRKTLAFFFQKNIENIHCQVKKKQNKIGQFIGIARKSHLV